MKSNEEIKAIAGSLTEEQNDLRETLNRHTQIITQLIDAMFTVSKGQEELFLKVNKLEHLAIEKERIKKDLELRIEKVENKAILPIIEKIKAKKKITVQELNELELFAGKRPENSEVWYFLGIEYWERNEFEKSLQSFDKRIQIDDKDGEAWCGRGQALQMLSRDKEALESFNKARSYTNCELLARYEALSMLELGRNEEALRLVDMAIRAENKDSDSWALKGLILAVVDRRAEALGCFEKALELNPESVLALANKAELLRLIGPEHYEEAKSILERALKLNPNDYQLSRNMGQLFNNLTLYEEAISYYDKAIELAPKDPCLYCLKAITLNHLGRNSDALANFDKAAEIGLKEECELFCINRAIVLGILNRKGEALSETEKAIAIKSDSGIAWGLKSSILLSLGRKDQGMKALETAIQCSFDPQGASKLNIFAWSLYEAGKQLDTALKFAKNATQKEPTVAPYFDTLACIQYKLGKDKEALLSFEKALSLRKNSKHITWDVLAKLYEKMGRKKEAEQAYEELKALEEAKRAKDVKK
ncbi:MAG: tetratricopeptide repeat protein [Candidatus Bathyarchaeota archaeon]|nr:tetratricopeptide repeat protein [Candidatus Bathyarchaeota archaeon]